MEYPHTITNTPYSFFEFQDDEKKLVEILADRGIKYGAGHRWARLYKTWAEKSRDVQVKKVAQVSPIETLNLLDLCEMNIIIKSLPPMSDNILAAKWKRLSGGTMNRFEETQSNADARNTQFELLVYADLKSRGITCNIGNPNPDILISEKATGINVECKRILNRSANSISRNVHDAVVQLREDHKANGYLGIIALNIERIFSQGNSFLQSNSQESALEYVRELHDKFYDENKRYWSSKAALGTTNVPMILLYTSTMAQLRTGSLKFAHVTEADRMGTIASDASRKQFRKLHKILNKGTNENFISHIHGDKL